MELKRPAYSYRSDPLVPDFPDNLPVIIFDGHCIFCSAWARFVVRHDKAGKIRLLAAQSPLGEALYRHFGLNPTDYDTNILLIDGIARTKSDATLAMFSLLGWPWSLAAVFRILPALVRDWLYDRVARNRFRLFGRSDKCFAPTADNRERFLQ